MSLSVHAELSKPSPPAAWHSPVHRAGIPRAGGLPCLAATLAGCPTGLDGSLSVGGQHRASLCDRGRFRGIALGVIASLACVYVKVCGLQRKHRGTSQTVPPLCPVRGAGAELGMLRDLCYLLPPSTLHALSLPPIALGPVLRAKSLDPGLCRALAVLCKWEGYNSELRGRGVAGPGCSWHGLQSAKQSPK